MLRLLIAQSPLSAVAPPHIPMRPYISLTRTRSTISQRLNWSQQWHCWHVSGRKAAATKSQQRARVRRSYHVWPLTNSQLPIGVPLRAIFQSESAHAMNRWEHRTPKYAFHVPHIPLYYVEMPRCNIGACSARLTNTELFYFMLAAPAVSALINPRNLVHWITETWSHEIPALSILVLFAGSWG